MQKSDLSNSYIYWFLIPYFLFLLLALPFVFTNEIGDFVIWVNQHHSAVGDVLFKYLSYLGNAIMYLWVFIVLLLLRKKKEALNLALVLGVTALVVLVSKEYLFGENLRPKRYLSDYPFQFVEGVKVYGTNAFPSGHTSDAFGLAFFLTLLVRHKLFSLLMCVIAISVGIARIYLVQHFLIDVCAGSMIGIMGAIIAAFLMDKIWSKSKS